MKNTFRFLVLMTSIFIGTNLSIAQSTPVCTPGWTGTVLIDCESTANWSVEADIGSSGNIAIVKGVLGGAVQLNWNGGTGTWVQAKYTFSQPVDLSQKDIFGLSLQGSIGKAHTVSIMFADKNDVFYGLDCNGISSISFWMKNLIFPKKLFRFFWGPSTTIDWTSINRFFVAVKNLDNSRGQLAIDHLQADRAADWPQQTVFETVLSDTAAKSRCIQYILSQQTENTGLFVSWKEEPVPKSWLYEQALVLIVLTREGHWEGTNPKNKAAQKAKKLVDFITSQQDMNDGHWPRGWDSTGVKLVDDLWVGDQAWWVMALVEYAEKSRDTAALASSGKGADWLASKVGTNGKVVPSTEGTVDTWWAMVAAQHFDKADAIQNYLLTKVWDADLHYWWRGRDDNDNLDPVVAMDCATWTGAFAASTRVHRPDMANAALSFVRRTLVTTSSGGTLCGFDGMGPVSIWCEGTAQYVSAGGQDAQQFLNLLLSLQHTDGGMPGSPDSVAGSDFGWLTKWTGLAPTAWLYFALTQMPFPNQTPVGINEFGQSPSLFALYQSYPNPFNPSTTISFSLPARSFVSLKVFDALGREVATLVSGQLSAGYYSTQWIAATMSSGVYFYRIEAGLFVETKKLVLLR